MSDKGRIYQLSEKALAGKISRRAALACGSALALTGMSPSSLSRERSLAASVQDRDPVICAFDWQLLYHPVLFEIGEELGVVVEEAPNVGFSFDRFITEKNAGTSTWDAYTGVTPFHEMKPLADTETIEPWDPFLPEGVKEDIFPATVEEGTYNGSLYVWPLMLDIVVQGWNASVVERAGLDPNSSPATWEEFVAHARAVQESGAAPYGCVFDNRDWRSLIPITHSFDTDVYSPDGLFIYTHDAAVNALEVMKAMMEWTAPDILSDASADALVLVDEAIWSSEQAGYYYKYQTALHATAQTWNDPSVQKMAKLPSEPGTAGGTVFWDTGGVLFTHGQNKELAATFMHAFCTDNRVWEHSVIGDPDQGIPPAGQLPILQSVWAEWESEPPAFLDGADWVFAVRDSLAAARAIQPTAIAISQFDVARPEWHKYLSGEIAAARTALTKAYDAVRAEFKRQTGTPAQ